MKTVSIYDLEIHLLSVLSEIEQQGGHVVIYRDGVPIVDLIPHRRKSRLTPHPLISRIFINYDPTEPLTGDEWPEED